MHFIDLYPQQGSFQPGQPVQITAVVWSEGKQAAALEWTVTHLVEIAAVAQQPVVLTPGEHILTFAWNPPPEAGVGYGIRARLLDNQGIERDQSTSACDVLEHWTDHPRYGFLCDFFPGRQDVEATLDTLASLHINALQFYDWQYRHHALVPPENEYIDALGRRLSLETVKDLIQAAHERGMAALPYLAVYAAGLDFWADHPEWALYDPQGQPHKFFDFLGLMNPAPGSGWAEHLLAECQHVLKALPFDGLHVDQYGDPKSGFDAELQPIDLPAAFGDFINQLKTRFPKAEVLFNAVGNWPIENLAAAPVDAVYIEVWPPAVKNTDLVEIIRNARLISGGKSVVIAVYQPVENEANILLTDAFILAAGGTRIALGEQARWLADPYFPKHQPLPDACYQQRRKWNDFIVQYGELLGPQAPEALGVQVSGPAELIAFPRQVKGWTAIGFINISGLDEPRWNEKHQVPGSMHDIPVEIRSLPVVLQAWWASPEDSGQEPLQLTYQQDGERLEIHLPKINYFGLLILKMER